MKQVLYILSFFIVDSFLENFWIFHEWLYPSPEPADYNEAMKIFYEQQDIYLISGSYRFVIPWIILLTVKKFMPFDFWDRLLMVLCSLFPIIGIYDWYANLNQRDQGIDWLVFGVLLFGILWLKYFFKSKNMNIAK